MTKSELRLLVTNYKKQNQTFINQYQTSSISSPPLPNPPRTDRPVFLLQITPSGLLLAFLNSVTFLWHSKHAFHTVHQYINRLQRHVMHIIRPVIEHIRRTILGAPSLLIL